MNSWKNVFVFALAVVFALAQFGAAAQNDRATFGLKGNVSKVIKKGELVSFGGFWEGFNLEFSPNGMLSKIDGKEIEMETEQDGVYYTVDFESDDYSSTLVFYRTPQRRISSYYFDDGGSIGENTVIYDSKGRVALIKMFAYIEAGYNPETGKMEDGRTVESGSVKYYYDENDNVIKVVQSFSESDQSFTMTYKYRLFDSADNWLIRVVNCEEMEIKNQVESRIVEY